MTSDVAATALTASTAEHAPLPRKAAVLFTVFGALAKIGLLPSNEKMLGWPAAKRNAQKPASFMVPKPRTDVTVEDVTTDGGVVLRTYRPTSAPPGTAVLYVHGGGFAFGGLDSLDWVLRELAHAGHAVASVDYRLAPEFAYPHGLDDVADGLAWLEARRADWGFDRLVVGGDSAGGNLAAALCLRNRDEAGPQVDLQVLVYPALDLTLASPSMQAPSPGLTPDGMKLMQKIYVGTGDPADPYVSPLHAADLAGLPAAVVMTAEHDMLRDDGSRYAEALAAAGVDVWFRQYPGTPHGFFSLYRLCGPEAERALADLLAALQR